MPSGPRGGSRSCTHRVTPRSKTWITETARIDAAWFTADAIAEAEREAIRSEHPVYNIHHNRLTVEVTAEVTLSPPSPEGIAAMLAMILAGGMAAVWAFDFLANWNVKRRAERAGQQVELPPPRNLFTQDPQHWSARLLQALVTIATPAMGDLEERELRRQEAVDRFVEQTQGFNKTGKTAATGACTATLCQGWEQMDAERQHALAPFCAARKLPGPS